MTLYPPPLSKARLPSQAKKLSELGQIHHHESGDDERLERLVKTLGLAGKCWEPSFLSISPVPPGIVLHLFLCLVDRQEMIYWLHWRSEAMGKRATDQISLHGRGVSGEKL